MEDVPEQTRSMRHPLRALALGAAVFCGAAALLGTLGIAPAPLTGQHDTMRSYRLLRETVAEEGPDDVLTIGSSVCQRGVVPSAVAATLAEKLAAARPPRVFNFGAPGHNVLTYPTLVELALQVERPRVVVFLITPRGLDASADRINRWTEFVATSPYAEALEDPWRLRGRIYRAWLDHSPLARYGPTLRARLTGEIASVRGKPGPEPERGYLPIEAVEIRPAMLERQREVVAEWKSSPEFTAALDRAVAAARGAGARVLLVDAPLSPSIRSLMRDPARNIGGNRRFLEDAHERLGVAIAFAPENLVAQDEYADLVHFVRSGAERYSRWLGGEIARSFPNLRFD